MTSKEMLFDPDVSSPGYPSTSQKPLDETPRRFRLTTKLSLILLLCAYLPLALTYCFLTRAYENEDEGSHTQYIENVMNGDYLPKIGAPGAENQEPPLYYEVAAAWQHLLGIPAFTPTFSFAKHIGPNQLFLNHNYSPAQREDAKRLRELRLLSVLLGLGTVWMTYAAAKLLRLSDLLAFSAGLFVAWWPRELQISSSVTNDALAIPLCALALVLFLLSERARSTRNVARRRVYLCSMGLTLGAAAITKLTSLPIAGILLALSALPILTSWRHSNRPRGRYPSGPTSHLRIDFSKALDVALVCATFLIISGWWLVRNKILYGQFLASSASEKTLGIFAGSVPWSFHLLFVQFPHVLWRTSWYYEPTLVLPDWMNDLLAAGAIICVVMGIWALLARTRRSWNGLLERLPALAVIGSVLGGLAAEVLHIKTTNIGDSRLAYVCLSALALLLVLGSRRVFSFFGDRVRLFGTFAWPGVILLLNFYALFRWVVPLGGL